MKQNHISLCVAPRSHVRPLTHTTPLDHTPHHTQKQPEHLETRQHAHWPGEGGGVGEVSSLPPQKGHTKQRRKGCVTITTRMNGVLCCVICA